MAERTPHANDEWVADFRRRLHGFGNDLAVLRADYHKLSEKLESLDSTVHQIATANEIGAEVQRRIERLRERERRNILSGLTAGQKVLGLLLLLAQLGVAVLALVGR